MPEAVNIARNLRVLIVAAHLRQQRHAPLYGFIEWAGVAAAKRILKGYYGRIIVLQGEKATVSAFQNVVDETGRDESVTAIDVIINMHGGSGTLTFASGSTIGYPEVVFSTVAQQKLRLLYSTACFGASGNQWWLEHGFMTAIGAQGLNINAFPEYLIFLSAWARGGSALSALIKASGSLSRLPDVLARLIGKNADSRKQIAGREDITISSV